MKDDDYEDKLFGPYDTLDVLKRLLKRRTVDVERSPGETDEELRESIRVYEDKNNV